ncbi:MAG: hypothetical protein QGF59_06105 [Pirellulaceae bacterium]|jgi:hypothetical protein|nr:hypothetical protein [Pirellulaceae bacterium]MDP6718203.1 hypothetical protein [Pirellulaceae bacterium]
MSEKPPHAPELTTTHDLLTIRQFAGLAMQALISHDGLPESDSAREEYALWSYRMAQAMLAMENRLHIVEPSTD